MKIDMLKEMGETTACTNERIKTDIPTIIEKISSSLDIGDISSTREISIKTGFSRQTVDKYLTVLSKVEMTGIIMLVKESEKLKLWKKERPERLCYFSEFSLQSIRDKYFPKIEERDVILAELFKKGAFSEDTSFKMDRNDIINKLLEIGRLKETSKGYYLSSAGKTIAEGLLKMYPELN